METYSIIRNSNRIFYIYNNDDSPYQFVSMYWSIVDMIYTKPYQYIDTWYDGAYWQTDMCRPYRSPVRLIHTAYTEQYDKPW